MQAAAAAGVGTPLRTRPALLMTIEVAWSAPRWSQTVIDTFEPAELPSGR